jgi:hypothetical protein
VVQVPGGEEDPLLPAGVRVDGVLLNIAHTVMLASNISYRSTTPLPKRSQTENNGEVSTQKKVHIHRRLYKTICHVVPSAQTLC